MSGSRTPPPFPPGRLAKRALPVIAVLALVLVLTGCVTDPATSVSGTGATLNGRFNPLNAPAVGYFEYGTTASYGSETSPRVDLGSGADNIALSKRVTGLSPNTEYHFRACQIREGAKVCGADRTFRTASDSLPAGFEEVIAFQGLTNPTALRFAADGRVFVAERSGLIKVFDGLDDPTASVFADLRTQVHAFWDRGLLGLALDPAFPARPFVYVSYAHDAPIGGTAPRWGVAGATSDPCPTPPGPTADGCVISGRVSRLTADGETPVPEQVLVEDWCQQFPSHSVGSLAFGPDGALYASGGDGASFNGVDYGQFGSPRNPCGDAPGDVGDTLTPPSAEGGALRSQDLRSAGDPASLSGSIIRIDPETGEGLPGNPGAASSDRNVRRIVAQGLRNPMRITTRPGTGELWVGDVGWSQVEEVNRLTSPADGVVDNFGWPCYEGPGRQGSYDAANLSVCEALYTSGTHSAPYFSYRHSDPVVPGEQCGVGSSSITGVAFGFYGGGPYPAAYDGALFFADYTRNCIWMLAVRRRRAAERGREGEVRRARPEPGRSADLAHRRAVLRRLQRRHDPAHRLLGRQPPPGRRRLRRPDQRAATADRAVRRFDLRRPGLRCCAGLRLGPGRRRPVRRLDRRAAVLHVHAGGDLHGAAKGHRRRRLERHRRRGHLRRQHSAHGHDLVTQPGPELEGRRHDLLRR